MEYANQVEDKRPDSNKYLPGGQAVDTLQKVIDRLLLPKGIKRQVTTDKKGFFNQDCWPLRTITAEICERSEKDSLTLKMVRDSIIIGNRYKIDPCINIPIKETPTKQRMKALIGGAFHEAFHTLYDVRDEVPRSSAKNIFEFVGTKIKWKPYLETILFWKNEIQDVFIEENGRKDYPHCRPFIRELHRSRVNDLRSDYAKGKLDVLNAAAFAFRHFAFDYRDATSDYFLKIVRKQHKTVVDLFSPGGKFYHYIISARNQEGHGILRPLELTFNLLSDLRRTVPEICDGGDLFYRNLQKLHWGHCRIDSSTNLLDLMVGGAGDGHGHLFRRLLKDSNRDEAITRKQNIIHVGKGQKSSTFTSKSVEMLRSVRRQICYYRSRLRTKILAMEIVRDTHGIEDGIDISEECFFNIREAQALRNPPTNFEWEKGKAIDTSTAAYLLADMSGSMCGDTEDVAKTCLSVMDPLESLGCKTMCSGFENSWSGESIVNHHVFKHWDEIYRNVRWRMPLLDARGGTPMAEGMQFALNALNSRKEGNRLLFIITDGCPNGSKQEIKELIRVAEMAGIVTLGIGFGGGATYVQQLFPDDCHVWASEASQLPPLVVKKLLKKLNPDKRGQRMKKQVIKNLSWSA